MDYLDNIFYDCLIIGGTSAEPVTSHLSKTDLNTLIIDQSNIYKEYDQVDKTSNFLQGLPKQIFSIKIFKIK